MNIKVEYCTYYPECRGWPRCGKGLTPALKEQFERLKLFYDIFGGKPRCYRRRENG